MGEGNGLPLYGKIPYGYNFAYGAEEWKKKPEGLA